VTGLLVECQPTLGRETRLPTVCTRLDVQVSARAGRSARLHPEAFMPAHPHPPHISEAYKGVVQFRRRRPSRIRTSRGARERARVLNAVFLADEVPSFETLVCFVGQESPLRLPLA